ncbi:MAG: kinase [Deltaproteobacteria bacterium]|nr:kinase [Deltaproteobacteria bacterium]
MIISRTPYRISFFGGGTDYPDWYKENGGTVLATTIDKYCYLSCRYLPPFFEHKYRIVYSKIESVKEISEIVHPAVKAILHHMKIEEGLEIHHDGDIPARTGIGSSSSFVVGLLHAIHALKGNMPTKKQLAREAIHIERDILKEEGGIQDQIHAAVGGFNKIVINQEGEFQVIPITLNKEKLRLLQSHLMLYFTGFSRDAFKISKSQVENIPRKTRELTVMQQMVDEAVSVLNGHNSIYEFGKLLHEAWALKRSLSEKISTSEIDEIYKASREAGAIGGKLLGAGGGGFILLFVNPENQPSVKERFNKLLQVPFKFEALGSQIAVYEPDFTPNYHTQK